MADQLLALLSAHDGVAHAPGALHTKRSASAGGALGLPKQPSALLPKQPSLLSGQASLAVAWYDAHEGDFEDAPDLPTAASLGRAASVPPAASPSAAAAPSPDDDPSVNPFSYLGPRDVHPWHKPAQPSHEAMKASPHRPVFVTANPMAGCQVFEGNPDVARELPINGAAFAVDSEMFSGRIEIHLRGLKTSRKDLFDGKKRCFQVAVQGRFKRPVEADALCIGQEFVKPGNVPGWVGELVLTAASKVFSSSAHVNINTLLPYFMNPVLAACQLVNVSEPGAEPADLWEAKEDMRLFSGDLVDKHGSPLPADKRRKWCDVPKHLAGKTFSPDHVYTFHIWQHLIDFSSYKLSVGGFVNLDLAAALNAQPLQLTCKDIKTKQYLFSTLVWHERLLYDEDTWTAAQSLASRWGSVGSGLRGMFGRGKAA